MDKDVHCVSLSSDILLNRRPNTAVGKVSHLNSKPSIKGKWLCLPYTVLPVVNFQDIFVKPIFYMPCEMDSKIISSLLYLWKYKPFYRENFKNIKMLSQY
ncbi:hypothetical protein KIL84_007525 [Mauremys mutica]|uniref:Uncharacterized protein n=1 Tax=Mauremys mutica TaxID=74926 RepID=A0A9D3X1G9_9SAUR|nr:hypothetical protein KIL84_007525 [Mauremys mutica]